MPGPRRLLQQASSLLLLVALSATTVSAIPASQLFHRQSESTCAAEGFSKCSQAGLPDNFCCPTDSTCIPLAANTAVLCCPNGSDCSIIQSVTCDINKQDPEKNPKAQLKSTVLDIDLRKCGDKCCPWGYSCNTGGHCQKDADQSKTPQELNNKPPPSPITTATQALTSGSQPTQTTSTSIFSVAEPPAGTDEPTSTHEPTASSKPTASGDKSAGDAKPVESGKPEHEEPEEKSGGSPTAIIAGVVAGVAVFLIVGLIALYFCVLKRKGKAPGGAGAGNGHHGHGEKPRLNRSTSSFGNIISNPIVAEDTIRTDFNRSVSAQSHRRPDSDFAAVAGNVNPFDTPPRGAGSNVPGPSAYTGTGTNSRNNSPPPAAGGRPGYTTPPITPWGATSGGGGGGGGQGGPDSPRGNSGVSINVFADPRTLTPERLAKSNDNANNSNNNNNTYSKFIPNTNSTYPYLNNNNDTNIPIPNNYNTDDYDPFNPDNNHHQGQTRPVTTFTAMMEEADLGAVARGAKYVPPTPKTPAGLLGPQVPGAGSMPNNNRF
ncbi:hypothetical protein SMACR_00336 [Sordaria macrospora]|uniref:Mid2 domain-containing protein n=1 Tax=Sordaria macrospora TaxID=5147 RepID=A0A8S9A580_SORMA|nr:hypothetical protein SMACR_00336 [Sordaria macrospora]KAH7627717.1 hypothetical protein B0T09DRAFT_359964 [Sordaria sp. MPI-SDFR-AT-0083]WPJ59080.1 hypothetical protein SMAC4_00336 [Sordaria macrospora]